MPENDDVFEIYEENWLAILALNALQTQWELRTTPSGQKFGLIYPAVIAVLEHDPRFSLKLLPELQLAEQIINEALAKQ